MIELLEGQSGESTKNYVTRVLIHNIVNINLEPGEKIMENELCSQFKVSRTPIREAVLELSQKHLIDIYPKRGTYVSYIDPELVEEVRSLRCVLESELAKSACSQLRGDQIDRLRENIAVWRYYMEKKNEKKILQLDKEFHSLLYSMCHKNYWNELVESISPQFDRTIILSFRCRPISVILSDHEQLVDAIEQKDENRAYEIARQHMRRYIENRELMKEKYPQYFAEN